VAVLSSASTPFPAGGHRHYESPTGFSFACGALAAATTAFVASLATHTSQCEEREKTPPITDRNTQPLWPDGVSEVDVDALVDEFLKDPSINITLLPDAIEAQVYKSTILLTLNTFYSVLASLDGLPILAHEVQLTRKSKPPNAMPYEHLVQKSKTVNDKILEQVADRLLANPTINSPLVPDAVEREVYVNCLKVIFRVLMVIANSFRLTICGHDLLFAMEPANLEQSAVTVSSSLSQVDMKLLQKFAHEAGVVETAPLSWWDRLWIRREFVAQLHASLYGLILGVVDDILANTRIQILSDDIDLDIVPAKAKSKVTEASPTSKDEAEWSSRNEQVPAGFAAASFAMGFGVGVAFMVILTRQQ
jgi:hypothetical protein